MWLARARQLCPQLVVLPYEFDKYERVAVSFFTILCRTFAEVEAFSCDEAMVQTAAHGAERIAASVRDVIFAETRCTATAGIAHSPALARLATRMAKPNGQHFIAKGSEIAQVGHMAVGALHGVGHKYAKKLEQAGLRTVSDMSECRVEHLRELFGPRLGEKIWRTGRFEVRTREPALASAAGGRELTMHATCCRMRDHCARRSRARRSALR